MESKSDDSSSSDFKRWSRNLSAKRHRELDRLNEIERRRQLLEIKRQNDLLEQMSFSAAVAPPGKQVNEKVDDKEVKDLEQKVSLDNIKVRHCVDELPAPKQKVELEQLEAPNCSLVESQAQAQVKVQKRVDNVGSAGGVHPKVRLDKTKELELQIPRELSSSQLIEFVSTCVPKNKRVLCLIVRDKVSKLNQAKAYFYPTYYLFIQAIIDLDQDQQQSINLKTTSISEDNNLQQISSCHQLNHSNNHSDQDLTMTGDKRFSADNSFSASSSISADMMFIGTIDQSTIGTIKLAGNSYSDNELGGDDDDDEQIDLNHDNEQLPAQTPDLNELKKERVNYARNCIINKDRRDSTLVFPDNNSNKSNLSSNLSNTNKRNPSDVLNINNDEAVDFEDDEDEEEDDEDDEEDDEINHYDKHEIMGQNKSNNNDLLMAKLFDNDQNPYTGIAGVLLAGKKRKKAKTYLIGPHEHGFTKKNCICKLKSNVLGTQFNAIRLSQAERDDRYTIASINYETNVLGFKGPRKMRVFLSKQNSSNQLDSGVKNLGEIYKRDPNLVVQLKNMAPSWNVESQSYVLNFHGRVTQASVKNFQLIVECDNNDNNQLAENNNHNLRGQSLHTLDFVNSTNSTKELGQGLNGPSSSSSCQQIISASERLSRANGNNQFENGNDRQVIVHHQQQQQQRHQTDDNKLGQSSVIAHYNSSIVMQFGRISSHEFTCDVSYPLSIMQAFSIALSSFDSKLACE